LQIGSQFDPNYSSRYLVHRDGSPFYGVGHGDVFSIANFANQTERLVANMNEAGENYVLWWPQFYFSVVEDDFDYYSVDKLKLIDSVLDILTGLINFYLQLAFLQMTKHGFGKPMCIDT
jgi:hypothetical protein